MFRVTADFLAVEDVEGAELADGLLGEVAEGDVDEPFAEAFGEATPRGSGRGVGE